MSMLEKLRFIITLLVLILKLLYFIMAPVYVLIDCERNCRSYYAMIVRRKDLHPSIGFTTNALIVVHTILGFYDSVS
jgi:hypothetical protein